MRNLFLKRLAKWLWVSREGLDEKTEQFFSNTKKEIKQLLNHAEEVRNQLFQGQYMSSKNERKLNVKSMSKYL